ncbi:MAG: hypothetical protein KAT58_00935 [candidate division Zixibacteria bacterium]|nr:hypothetical protein [candidate division Zixibacteria bacterium]
MTKATLWRDESDKVGALWRRFLSFFPPEGFIGVDDYEKMCDYYYVQREVERLPGFSYHCDLTQAKSPDFIDWLDDKCDYLTHSLAYMRLGEVIISKKSKLLHDRLADHLKHENIETGTRVDEFRALISSRLGKFLGIEYLIESFESDRSLITELLDNPEIRRLTTQLSDLKKHYDRMARAALLHSTITMSIKEIRPIFEIEWFRDLARKTWSLDVNFKRRWTAIELEWVEYYYSRLPRTLLLPSQIDAGSLVDGNVCDVESIDRDYVTVVPINKEEADLLLICVTTDFVRELIQFNRHPAIKGTALCVECGRFYARSFYGQNQKYCSNQCKNRVAARRKREKRRAALFKRRKLK